MNLYSTDEIEYKFVLKTIFYIIGYQTSQFYDTSLSMGYLAQGNIESHSEGAKRIDTQSDHISNSSQCY